MRGTGFFYWRKMDIAYTRPVVAYGRNGDIHQSGLSIITNEGSNVVALCPVTSKDRVSYNAVLQVPIENLSSLIEELQRMQKKYGAR